MPLLHHILKKVANSYPNRVAFYGPENKLIYSEFIDQVEFIAGALQKLGVKKGDRLAILAPNCANYIAYHYASAYIGSILVVLNNRHTTDECAYAINDSEAYALIIHEEFAEFHEAIVSRCTSLKFTVGLGEVHNATYAHSKLLALRLRVQRVPHIAEKDPVLLIYTSGTTGRPKGALQTHEGSVMADSLTANYLEMTENDVYLAFMPYFHQAGLIRTRATLSRGGTNLITGKLDAQSMADCIIRRHISIIMLVPPLDTLLFKVIKDTDITFPSLRFILSGGGLGPIHAKRMKAFCKKVNCRYMGIYGQTEVTGTVVATFDENYFQKPYSCGRPLPGIDLEIWDDSGSAVAPNVVGEIMIRSKMCIPKYWRNEQATAELFTGEWLHTGDLGRLDEDGFLYFVDRKKELIKSGGENVYPKEVENILRTHPDILDLAIIGIPDIEGWGELVTAIVVPSNEKKISIEDIKAFCQGKIAGYKIPKYVHYMDVIPRNFTGKPLKLQMKEELISARLKAGGS